jgi:hypothetical protein
VLWIIAGRGLADGPMLAGGGVQFVVGGVLEGEQGFAGIGHSQEDLVELALSGSLMADPSVLDDEDHGQGQGGYHYLEDCFPPGGKSRRDAHDDLTSRPR